MIVLRLNYFSDLKNNKMIDKLTDKLEKSGIYDYEVVDKIQKDAITVDTNLTNLSIYIPVDLEYSQYDIDDFIRDLAPYFRTSTVFDRDIFVLKVAGNLNFEQYFKLVKFIITSEEFCCILKN